MAWKGVTIVGMLLFLALGQPTPLEQLEIVCAVVILSGALFHSFTVWRVRRILGNSDPDGENKTTSAQ